MFLRNDMTEAENLIAQYNRFSDLARTEANKGNFEDAETYSHHATMVLAEIRKLKDRKEMYDEARELFKQEEVSGLIHKMFNGGR